MALGNTFGATALSSYGGFWISLGIVFTPGGFGIATAYGGTGAAFYNALGFLIMVSPLRTGRPNGKRKLLIQPGLDDLHLSHVDLYAALNGCILQSALLRLAHFSDAWRRLPR